jgi:uncharacterized protein YukE
MSPSPPEREPLRGLADALEALRDALASAGDSFRALRDAVAGPPRPPTTGPTPRRSKNPRFH